MKHSSTKFNSVVAGLLAIFSVSLTACASRDEQVQDVSSAVQVLRELSPLRSEVVALLKIHENGGPLTQKAYNNAIRLAVATCLAPMMKDNAEPIPEDKRVLCDRAFEVEAQLPRKAK